MAVLYNCISQCYNLLQLLKIIAVTETGRGKKSSVLPVRTAADVQGGFVTVAFIYYTVEHGDAHE